VITRAFSIGLLVLGLSAAPSLAADHKACTEGEKCRELVPVTDKVSLPVYSSLSLTKPDETATRALIIIHGTDRTGEAYFRTGIATAKRAKQENNTLVVAPTFLLLRDVKQRPGDELYWDTNNSWKDGGISARARPQQVSSFAALDAVVKRLGDRKLFSNIKIIVIAGHSAGGQIVQRYAAGQPNGLVDSAITLRFVSANPSSYLYLGKERPAGDGQFAVPGSACSYDNYKYGLEHRNEYMGGSEAASLIQRYRDRDVIYLLGGKDTNTNDDDLDITCGAMLQGPHRLARGQAFKAYMDKFQAPHKHRLMVVPNSGHSRNNMFNSNVGAKALFD
jgi:pimeloyl-ACP methyl ester carboxylesterase